MSKIGIAVVGRSLEAIAASAKAARAKLTIPDGRLAMPMDWLLEQRVRPLLDVELDVRRDDDDEILGTYAAFDASTRVLMVRESLFRGCTLGTPEAVFTISHEIGHIWMHSDQTYFRRIEPHRAPKKQCNPEWQADMFAAEFISDRRHLESAADPLTTLLRWGVPKQQALLYLAELRTTQERDLRTELLDQLIQRGGAQDGFDF